MRCEASRRSRSRNLRTALSMRPIPLLLVSPLYNHTFLSLLTGGTLWAKASMGHQDSSLPRPKLTAKYLETLELLLLLIGSGTTSRLWSLSELAMSSLSPRSQSSPRVKGLLMSPPIGPRRLCAPHTVPPTWLCARS